MGETYPSGLNSRTVENSYDRNNRLMVEAVTSGTAVVTTSYGYDSRNNRTSKVLTGGMGAGTTTYTYNDLNQLTDYSDSAQSVALSYDAAGNRVARTITGGTNAGTDTYTYDGENRLVRLEASHEAAKTYSYTYDYRTRRVVRDESQAGGVITKVVFSGGTSVMELEGESTTPAVEYIRGSDYGGGVGGILYTIRGSNPSYTHENRRGDVIAKTNTNGVLTYQASYEAFGTRTQEQGSTQDRQKANTKDEDPTRLLCEGFRYRDLETGVFITADPLGFQAGPNFYTYVKQNPWTLFDPEGLLSDDERKAIMENNKKAAQVLQKHKVSERTAKQEIQEMQKYSSYAKRMHKMYPGQNDTDIAIAESARTNMVRAKVALANHGELPNAEVNKLRMRGMATLAEASYDIAQLCIPFGAAGRVAKALLPGEVAVGKTGVATAEEYLYRGIPGGTTKAEQALNGVVMPRGTAVDTASLVKHVLSEDVASGVTSWTTNPSVAGRFAGSQGMVVKVPYSSVSGQVVARPNVGNYGAESEVLLQGAVRLR